MKLVLPALLMLLAVAPRAHAQQRLTKQQEKNLVAFARIFGYVRYFHPSDEAQQISWPMLATKGSRQMLAVRNDEELIRELNSLFKPLGPTVAIFPTARPVAFDPAALQPPATVPATKVVSWQHQGIDTGEGRTYHGVRLNRPGTKTDTYFILKNVAVNRFVGLPYELDLTWSRHQPDDCRGLTFTITHRQTLGGLENSRATQRQPNQTLTAAGNHYLFGGKIDTAARQLAVALTIPDGFAGNLNVAAFVLVQGKRVPLKLEAEETGEPAQKQVLELIFNSPDLLAEPLFAEQSRLGDHLTREVAEGISCTVPLALAGDAAHTYPISDSLQINQLRIKPADRARYPAEWARYQGERIIGLPEVRLANIVEGWNALRHGYAYWDSAALPPDSLLRQTLRQAYADNTTLGFVRTLQLMLAALNDGHAWVTTTFEQPNNANVPLAFARAEGHVVVSKVLHPTETPQVQRGDVVEAIDGVPVEQVLAERAKLWSGSPQSNEYHAFWQLAGAPRKQPTALRLRRGDSLRTVSLPRSIGWGVVSTPPARANGWLAPGIYYYNLDKIGDDLSPAEYQTLTQAKAIIFDIRCYPKGGLFKLIPLLLQAPGDVKLVSELNMLRPDQEAVRYQPQVVHYAPGAQHLPGKVFFLTDAVTQSAPETFLGFIRGLGVGTFVGRPTSGANGGRSQLPLQGGFAIGYSGERVLNADGSRHHTIGIRPDVLVTPTLESIRSGQDLILETALKLAKSRN